MEKVRPDMEDGMGTSVVILHTKKAQEIWEQIKADLRWFACGKEDVLQPRLTGPTKAAGGRKRFQSLYRALPFSVFRFAFVGMMSLRALWKRTVK